jgi:hypothetical protein
MAGEKANEPGEPWYFMALVAYANMLLLLAALAAISALLVAVGLVFKVPDARPEMLWNGISLALTLPLPAALLRAVADIGRRGRRRSG